MPVNTKLHFVLQSTQTKDKVNGSVQLNGGVIEELDGRMLGIDDNVSFNSL